MNVSPSFPSLSLRSLVLPLLLFLFFSVFILPVCAQTGKIISGVVLNGEGKPIAGATVRVPGTNFKTTTDEKGAFLLDVPAGESVVITFKGMRREVLTTENKTSFIVRMQPALGRDTDLDGDEEMGGRATAVRGQGVVSGTVKDESGMPVAGVTITVKSTGKSTITDAGGNFIIVVPAGRQTLMGSSVNLVSQEMVLQAGQTTVAMEMQSKSVNLNEVVVVGYSAQKKVNLTGAVSSVDFKKVQNIPQTNTLNILQGRLPGVSIVQPGGQPGVDQGSINIRGIGTLNDAAPLVIIDGVQSSLADLGNLNPAEVANISVLKDAASAAIYGARGANGVILVTTRDPGKRKLQVNFNSYYGVQSATYLPKFVDSWQWMILQNEAAGDIYDSATIAKLKNMEFNDTLGNTRWPQDLFKPAGMNSHNLSINGGTQALSYQAALGYLTQDGLMKNTGTERYNFRTNVRAQLSDRVETGFNFWGYLQNTGQPFSSINTIMTAMNQSYPYVPAKTSSGAWGVYGYPDGRGINNPLLLTEIGRDDLETFKGNVQTYLQFRPLNELRLRTSLSYAYENNFRERFNPTYAYPDLGGSPSYVNQNSQLQNVEGQDKQLQWQTTAIYNKLWGKKRALTLLAGHEFVNFKSRQFSATGFKMPTNDLQVLGSAVTDFNVGGSKQEWSLQSFFGRVNYVLSDRYLFEANLRADGSSRFPDGSKYGYFPSFSTGWIVSKEDFFEPLSSAVSLLKFRVGWGRTGNDRIGNFSFRQYMNLGGFYGIGGALQPAGSITAFANPDLKWETTTSTNVGIDLGILNNKVLANFDVFDRVTDDILFRLPLPASFGNVEPAIQNIGKVSNKGWELNLEHRNTVGANLNYNIGVNLSYVRNTILDLKGTETIYGDNNRFILREGEAINSYYGFRTAGLYKSYADTVKYPRYSVNGFQPGALILSDLNNDGKVDTDDRVILGSANTPYTFGLTGGVAFKGVDLNFLFQGVWGKRIYLYDFGNRPGNAGNTNFWKEWWDNRYDSVTNPSGTWPVLKRTAPEIGQTTTDFFLRDASYLRLKNIELGYTLSTALLGRLKLRNLRFYVSGQNLLTFTRLIKQVDPERPALVEANNTYPQTKVMTVGLNLGL